MKKLVSFWAFLMCIIGIQAQQSLPTSGTHYLIKNQQVDDRYIGGNGTGNNAVKYEAAATTADYHVFLLTGDNTNGWTLKQVRSGLYVTHDNGYTGSYTTATGTNRQLFKFDDTQDNNYIVIQKKADNSNFVNGIGADSDAAGSTLYFNKVPSNERNRWVLEVATSGQILAAKKGAFNDLLATATTLSNNPSSWGYAEGAWATFTNALATANTFSSTIDIADETEIDNATTNLQAAIDAVQAAVLIPRFNADETKKYRILITDTEGNSVRYMAKDPGSTKAVPKTKDLAADPDLQLWYLHPVAGIIDGYKIQNVSTSQYLAANGEQINATESAAAVWVAVYNKNLTTTATTAADADGAWFRVNQDNSTSKWWCTDGGTWPSNTNMWNGKYSSATSGSLFRIEENPNAFAALSALIIVANNLAATITDAAGVATYLSAAATTAQGVVEGGDESAASDALVTLQAAIDLADSYLNAEAVASNASTISEGGTSVGQYPTTAKDELSTAITTAQGVGSTVETITGAINDLNAAVATFLNARNLPQDGKSYSIVHSSGKYLTISGTTVVLADKVDSDTENTQKFTFSIDASNPASFNILTANGYLANVTNYYTVDNNKAELTGENNERIVVTTNNVIYFNLRALSRGAADFLGQDNVGATGVYFNKSQALSNWTLEEFSDTATGIGSASAADPVISEKYYSLQGVEFPKQSASGLVIVKRTHQSGKNTVSKVLLNAR